MTNKLGQTGKDEQSSLSVREVADLIRAAESRGEQRGRVQGLRDAAVMALEDFQQIRAGGSVFSSWLRARADALDQQPPAETPHTGDTR